MQLTDKVAIVTGAASGIGKEIARRFVRQGAKVAIADLNLDAARKAAEELNASGSSTLAIQMDVTDEASRRDATDRIMNETDQYGVDVLVNSAGYGQMGPMEEIPADLLRRQLDVNVVALLAFTQPFLPAMRERRGERIRWMSWMLDAATRMKSHGTLSTRTAAPPDCGLRPVIGNRFSCIAVRMWRCNDPRCGSSSMNSTPSWASWTAPGIVRS